MDILNSYDANFVLLGSRRYVQGSSMTYGLLEALKSWSLGPVKRVRANIRSILKEQGRYDLIRDTSAKQLIERDYNVMFHVRCGSQDFFVGLKGRVEPVSASEPYDEVKLIEDCEIIKDSKSARLTLYPEAPLINIIITLNKKLLLSIFSTEGYGQWFLSRYDLDLKKTHLLEPTLLEIEVVGNIGATNTNSAIRLSGQSIGSIYFSRGIK